MGTFRHCRFRPSPKKVPEGSETDRVNQKSGRTLRGRSLPGSAPLADVSGGRDCRAVHRESQAGAEKQLKPVGPRLKPRTHLD